MNSVKMIIILSLEKMLKLKTKVLNLLIINRPTISYLARVIGIIIPCMPAATLGPPFHHYLEHDKVTYLRLFKGNFDALRKSKN